MAGKKDGKIWVDGLETTLTDLSSAQMIERGSVGAREPVRILPDIWVLKVGGQSIMDRGREAVYPIIEELREARRAGIEYILGVGGGTRARHAYALGLDIGMPTGALARIGASIPVQNARMLQMLMANDGAIMAYDDDFEKLPMYLDTGCIPVMSGMPPFEFWEKTPAIGRLPQNRTDAGVYLLAEFFGARGVIYIKDEDGLYTADPKKDKNAELIKNPTAAGLLASGQDDLIIERCVLEYMQTAKFVREVRVINGLKKGQVAAALRGEDVGVLIKAA
ncbi:MAG: hypothetical protein Tsb0010_05230 [Parvularculaceae bacterium]